MPHRAEAGGETEKPERVLVSFFLLVSKAPRLYFQVSPAWQSANSEFSHSPGELKGSQLTAVVNSLAND